ncbi:MAG: helix-turn-helix domain-containing protein [Rhodospirillaceae bacterium]
MLTKGDQPLLTVRCIMDMTADWYRLPHDAMQSPRRERRYAHPRQVAMWLAVQLLPLRSLPQIARDFQRDRTTILHALAAVQKRRRDRRTAADLNALRDAILIGTVSPSVDVELANLMAEETTEAFRRALLGLVTRDPAEFIRRVARLALQEAPADAP